MGRLFLILSLFFLCANASAESADDDSEKSYTVGVSRYVSTIDADFNRDFSGFAVSAAQNFTDNYSLRFTYYSLESDDLVFIDSEGYDIVFHFGIGLRTRGFKAYIGPGYFKDNVSGCAICGSASGLQVNGGLGYNWDKVALDFILSIRDASDYQDAFSPPPNNISVDVYSGSLLLSYRF
jgi:hypothetical protein